jgi:hypothetical protein
MTAAGFLFELFARSSLLLAMIWLAAADANQPPCLDPRSGRRARAARDPAGGILNPG